MTRAPSPAVLRELALTEEEYQRSAQLLGRIPNPLELGMLGAMWSEHCSYKTSKRLLRELPTRGDRVVLGPGENAGVVDLGDSLLCCFKIESHNHPSAIEPVQGAATGVGGILRDVFAMGARPVALLDAIRFGDPRDRLQRHRLARVVEGIGFYGNCIGVPTVGGETYFSQEYAGNCLVNAMCVGVTTRARLVRAVAAGVGNPVLLVGADTGRDGIHGATFASVQLDDLAEERRPAVQVGNPFLEKCLMEACLELCGHEALVGLQDCGAAGLTSSCSEMAKRGGVGIEIDVAEVGRRESGMTPYEVMLSESQERMVLVVERGREAEIQRVFERWDLRSDVIGRVIAEPELRVLDRGQEVGVLPLSVLVDGFSERRPPAAMPESVLTARSEDPCALTPPWGLEEAWLRLLASPNCADTTWVHRQYDHQVGDDTVWGPGSDAAVLRFKGRPDGIAITVDGAHRCSLLYPARGAAMAVAEGLRNLAVAGAEPLALTNCLNFGDPDQPAVMWQLEEAVQGLAEAATELGIPVVSGNVSLYNDYQGESIPPTPVVGLVGQLAISGLPPGPAFRASEDRIVLLGEGAPSLTGSEYQRLTQSGVSGPAPDLDLARERAQAALVRELVHSGILHSAHDLSVGGLALALTKGCVLGGLGALVRLPSPESSSNRPGDPYQALFGEGSGRYLLTVSPDGMSTLEAACRRSKVPLTDLGLVGGEVISFSGLARISLNQARDVLEQSLPELMESR
ncbi:MAG: phosphoribosylformylglycinamidine synthase subunit PurL [Candidatus Dormibacteria bacterium]